MKRLLPLCANAKTSLWAIILIAALGCTITHQLELHRDSKLRFSHAHHASTLGLNCQTCHNRFERFDDAGMPSLATCSACHRTEEQFATHLRPFLRNGALHWTNVAEMPSDIIFSHRIHYQAGVQCPTCHHGITKSRAASARLRMTMQGCTKCHSKLKLNNDCLKCHRTIRKDKKPSSHRPNWLQTHGQAVRAGTSANDEARCRLCHTEAHCLKCHQSQPPRDHTNYWRHRAHGLYARTDRERCATCHRTDFCTRCHQETPPRTHTTSWGSPTNRHCLACHFPLRHQACWVCHKTDDSHRAEAPDLPGDSLHQNASADQCRICHSASMRHPDPGDDCRRCHG